MPTGPREGFGTCCSHQPVAISHELTLAHEGERQRRAAVFHNPEDRPMIIDLGIAMRVGRKQRSSPSIWRLTSSEVQLTALAHG